MLKVIRRDEIHLHLGVLVVLFAVTAIGTTETSPIFSVFFGGLALGLFVGFGVSEKASRDEQAEREEITVWASVELDKLYRAGLESGEYWQCVYVIRDIDVTGYCKIGFSKTPNDRIGHFDVKLPFNVEVLHIIRCADPQRAETILHRRFADKRKRGEWFSLSHEDIAWLMQIGQA